MISVNIIFLQVSTKFTDSIKRAFHEEYLIRWVCEINYLWI